MIDIHNSSDDIDLQFRFNALLKRQKQKANGPGYKETELLVMKGFKTLKVIYNLSIAKGMQCCTVKEMGLVSKKHFLLKTKWNDDFFRYHKIK